MTKKFLFFLYLTGTGMATQAQTTISAIFPHNWIAKTQLIKQIKLIINGVVS
jgi:hypothetical protein